MSESRNSRRVMQGVVSSTTMDKSVVVRVERRYRHAKYGKFVRRNDKYMAHDEENVAKVGDIVEIMATRPMSKRKRWRLVRVIESPVSVEEVPS